MGENEGKYEINWLAAIPAEREFCAKICDQWIEQFGDREVTHISARQYAVDAIKDIADAIRARGYPPPERGGEG